MKVSELTGVMLDYWVARAEGEDAVLSDPYRDGSRNMVTYYGRDHNGKLDGRSYKPSEHWSDGGPIIERERIELFHQPGSPDRSRWSGKHMHTTGACYIKDGQTPLIAAMRAYVASKYGATVPDEEQCTDCQYEIEHDGKKVCRTMTRTHGQPCDAFKERDE